MTVQPRLIGYALWLVFVLAWNMSGKRAAQSIATAGAGRERLHRLVLALGLIMIWVAPIAPMWVNPPVLAWAMLSVVVAGIAFCWWARWHLGRLWSASVSRKDGHRIVDTGPYRLVRHPIYLGFIVMDVGLAMLAASWLGVIAVAMITLGLWLKARVEEHFLSDALGPAAYGDYQARTPMLVPRLARRPTTNYQRTN